MTQTNANDGKLKEKLAAIEHIRWAHWQKYMQGTIGVNSPRHTWDKDGNLTIPAALVKAWQRQIDTPYAELTEKEKDSDREQVDRYWPLIQSLLERREKVGGNTSDGYHTFNELYEFRMLYNAALFNEWAKQDIYQTHKSWKHSDGKLCFGGGWFVVVATLPTGQITNHYEEKDYGLFNVPYRPRAIQWDGHTPQDVAKRLREFLLAELSRRGGGKE